MTNRSLISPFALILLLLSSAAPLRAQDLSVHFTASNDVVEPGGLVTYTLIAANQGPNALENVQVELRLPDRIQNFSVSSVLGAGLDCGNSVCSADETVTWNVGTLDPGSFRMLTYDVFASDDGNGTLTTRATSSADGVSDNLQVHDVTVDAALLFRLSLVPDASPATESITYTLSYGNVGSANPSGVELRMEIPQGATFVSASGGGIEDEGTVTWNLGTLGIGAGGQVQIVVGAENSLENGSVIDASAEIDSDPTVAPTTVASSITPIGVREPLRIGYAVSQTSTGAGDGLVYTLTAANEGTAGLNDVAVQVRLPEGITGFSVGNVVGEGLDCGNSLCSPNETVTWLVGGLPAGESRVLDMITAIDGSAPPGEILRSRVQATSSGTRELSEFRDVQVDPSPLLRLNLVADQTPAVGGQPLTYTITFGNVGSTSPSSVVLRLQLPEGTMLQRTTGGGSESDGTVSWNLGTLGVGASGQVQATVLPESGLPAGALLEAAAELDSGVATEYILNSAVFTPLGSDSPLRISYDLSQSAVGSGHGLLVSLTAANESLAELLDVSIQLHLPDWFEPFSVGNVVGFGFDCGNSVCSPLETVSWNIGNLAPGQNRTIHFLTGFQADAPQGEIARSVLRAVSAGTPPMRLARDLTVDPTPILHLSVSPGPGPIVGGEAYTYTISFGNVGTSSTSAATLYATVPERATFASATAGGVESEGNVVWNLGEIDERYGGQVSFTVDVDTDISEGTVLQTRSWIDSGLSTEVIVRSSAAIPVRDNVPLHVEYDATPTAASPGETITFTLLAENESEADLSNVSMEVLLPDQITAFSVSSVVGDGLDCGNTVCSPSETVTWNVGTLSPTQSRTLLFTSDIADSSPRGVVLRSPLIATATGSDEVLLRQDFFVGNLLSFNQPPSPAIITSPADGQTITVGGAEGEPPMLGETPIAIEWQESIDPEGDPLTYAWQLSTSVDFTTTLIDDPSIGDGTATEFETDFGTIAQHLEDEGIELGDSITLYHRVMTFDGTHEVASDPFSIEFVRGTIVGAENEHSTPGEFALHAGFPNPFNPSITVRFDLPITVRATLTIYDALGRSISTLVSSDLPAGTHAYTWDAADLPSGVYFYRLEAGTYSSTKMVTLSK